MAGFAEWLGSRQHRDYWSRLTDAILAAAPQAGGILFDLPQGLAGAPAALQQHQVADRVRLIEGSFFDRVPQGGDVYLRILGNVRAAAGAGKRVLLVELVLPRHDRDFPGKWTDLEMLVALSARERTADEYGRLLGRASFQMTRVVETASPYSLVEGTAI